MGTLTRLTGSRLPVPVQIPETLQTVWRWQDWGYDPVNGRMVNTQQQPELLILYNYLVVSVSRHERP